MRLNVAISFVAMTCNPQNKCTQARRRTRLVAAAMTTLPFHAAADEALKSQNVWAGPYIGADISPGGLFGKYDSRAPYGSLGPQRVTTGFGDSRHDTPFLVGGFAGYNFQAGNLVFGVEGSASKMILRRAVNDYADEVGLQDLTPNLASLRFQSSHAASVRARFGYAIQNLLIFGTAGAAATETTAVNGAAYGGGLSRFQWGLTVGGGVEAKLSDQFSLGVEYRYSRYPGAGLQLSGPPVDAVPIFGRTSLTTHQTSLRLAYHPLSVGAAVDGFDRSKLEDWSIHGQSTFIAQGVPSFRNPYFGQNSLLPNEVRQTWSNTLYIGRRLWEGAEFYLNPEYVQGFGLSSANGLAGLSNGEATKAGFRNPHLRLQRYFLRQTIGFGGEQEDVDDGQNTIAGKRDVHRLTLTAGKFGINDIFDDNKYSHDPRLHFFNLALWESAAYDFPANLAGYTQGAVLDYNQKDWAIRAGAFQVPTEPNSDRLDYRIPRAGGGVIELEGRFNLVDQPGKIRLGAFLNRGRTGSNRDAVTLATYNPDISPDDAIRATRRNRRKSGVYLNLEQAVTNDIGLFARVSRSDGRNEILSFSDADYSLGGGLRFAGALWGRSNDTIGIGAAINGLFRSKAAFLAIGGSGLLIGDGALRYRPEQLAEAFYMTKLAENVTLTFDAQLIAHPGHNADRGPVPIFGTRLHFEF